MNNFMEHRNIIDALHAQIEALLDLMQCADHGCADTRSMSTAAEMCQTMLDDLMGEVEKIEKEWRDMKDAGLMGKGN